MHLKHYLLPLLLLGAACKSGPSDEELATSVNSSLSSSTGRINASVNKGVATLTGECPDEACKTNAESSVKAVKGVNEVVNNITVAPPAPPAVTITPDDSLKTAVQSAISEYKGVQASVSDGVVTLTGETSRKNLQDIMQAVTAMKPKKIENKLQLK
jgi:hyperosmotically inducible periplasmic protein